MRRFLKLVLPAALVVAIALPATALAHSRPVRFDPAPGSVLESAPSTVEGWFSSDLRRDPASSFIHVYDSAKRRVDNDSVQLSSDRRNMSVGLNSGLGGGSYLVHWSTFDDGDGEVFSDCFVFYVGQAAADAAQASGAPMDGSDVCPNAAPVTSATVGLDVDVDGTSATVNIEPVNFTPRAPDGSTRVGDAGHYHIYLDKAPVDVVLGHTHDESGGEMDSHDSGHDHGSSSSNPAGLVENPVQWADNSYTFNNLTPGSHTVAVALFHDDHTPFSPPVLAETTFSVGGSADGGGVDLWIVIIGVALALAAGLAIGKAVAVRPE